MANVTIPRYAKVIMWICAVFMPIFLILPFFISSWNKIPDKANNEFNDTSAQTVRLAPVGQLTIGKPSATSAAPEVATAFDPEKIYQTVCQACHAAGVSGAPKFGDKEAWQARVDARGGLDALVQQAIKGINAMPPKGGSALSDDDFAKMVIYMLDNSGVHL